MPAAKESERNAVTVRMFCQGLGDCFLVSIPQGEGDRPYWILIDCGVAMATPRQEEIMADVVGTIGKLTGHRLDLLVVTHEHWDHVSGFAQAGRLFSGFEIEHLWYAWTEKPGDKVADELRAKRRKAKLALARAHQQVAALDSVAGSARARDRFVRGLDGLLAFYGPPAAAARQGAVTIEEAMAAARNYVEAKRGKGAVGYLLPGQVHELPKGAGSERVTGLAAAVRAYVLGPPHSAKQVRKIKPSTRTPETYEKADPHFAAGLSWGWINALAAAEGGAGDAELTLDDAQPFDPQWRIPLETAQQDDFYKGRYFEGAAGSQQRRIDGDWLWSGAQQLALHLDSYTNNTSLVLAFELPASRKVLLFVGDAQVGSWLSWHDLEFMGRDGETVTVGELLGRTVLYKVGHHGSHNATLKERGLEMMTSPDLVAMVPVEEGAVKRLRYGEMPLKSLMTALDQRCDGRVLRIDRPWTSAEPPGTWGPGLRKARLVRGEGASAVPYLEYAILDTA